MGAKGKHPVHHELFRHLLMDMINDQHPLVVLERLIAGLLYHQHTFAVSNETLLRTSVENPYWQHFCGETHFSHRPPIDPSSLTRWRQRIGEEGVEWVLTETIEAAQRGKVVKRQSFDRGIVDSTAMEKAVAYPTDSRLLERGRQRLVRTCRGAGDYPEAELQP
jgi:IS5 family transposase